MDLLSGNVLQLYLAIDPAYKVFAGYMHQILSYILKFTDFQTSSEALNFLINTQTIITS
jgi:hypothetical protein